MTADQHDLSIRPISGRDEIDLFIRLPYTLDHELAADLDEGRRKPSWMWMALRGDRVVARAAWWARPHHAEPYALDVFELDDDAADRVDVGVRLLETAMAEVPATPQYIRFVPPGWREDPATRRRIEDRMTALSRTGARLFVERLRLEWRAGTPIPEPDAGRLVFRPVREAAELIGLMTEVLEGTLDAHSRAGLTRMTAREAAVAQYEDELAGYDSPHDWWRVATLPDGEPVGFVIPARNAYHPIIAYIGVRPAHRGHRHIDAILAEGTRLLAAEGAALIRASTDLGNVPMARAFARAGYDPFEHQIDMVWS